MRASAVDVRSERRATRTLHPSLGPSTILTILTLGTQSLPLLGLMFALSLCDGSRALHLHGTGAQFAVMSTVHTAIAPSFSPSPGGSGGKRGRDGGDDGRDRRRPDKPKPMDKISAADFGPEGRLRRLIMVLLEIANLGEPPSGSLLTGTGQLKTLGERITSVSRWVEGHIKAPNGLVQARYTELAESFVHVLRAANAAGFFDNLVAMFVELLSNRAVARTDDDEHD